MKTILVPSDFSESSAEATKYAILFAQKTERKLIFFNSTFILIPTGSSANEYESAVNDTKKKALNDLKKSVEKVYDNLNLTRNENTTRFLVKYGPSVVQNILETTEEHFIDLIVMGTHGASGFRKKIFGSNTTKIISESYCPVLTIPGGFKFSKVDRIAYAASGIENLNKELKKVVPIAQKLNASLEIFHITGKQDSKEDIEKMKSDRFLRSIIDNFKFENITIEVADGSDKPVPESIEEFIKRSKPDMLVMLTHKRSFFEKIFDSGKTTEIAFHPTIPLLALK